MANAARKDKSCVLSTKSYPPASQKAAVRLSRSTLDNESSGSRVTSAAYFDENAFSCNGYVSEAGYKLGVLNSNEGPPYPAFADGLSAALVVFGEFPVTKVLPWRFCRN